MLIGHVSDEYYAALADVLVEIRPPSGPPVTVRTSVSGAIHADVPAGRCEVCLARPGFGSKRVQVGVDPKKPVAFRLLSDRLLGYAWPKWCRSGEPVEF